MCRIAGIVDSLRYQDQIHEDVNHMIDTMIHGGPDGRGIFCDKIIALGHCRLSLLDLSDAAAQPMAYKNYVISYNGEIYNFNEIKKELISKSHTFSTQSDTEVILHAYEEWGVNAFSKFNGMFAFALLDKENKELFLVRDPNGIKPLYYFTADKQLIFASETKAFKSFIDEENDFWKVLFLAYGHLPEPYTKFKDVRALAKSTYLKYSLINSNYSVHSYQYHSTKKLQQIGPADIAYELRAAVNRHLISDAAIGLFLSGGIDSSILTLLAAEKTEHLHTLSIYFNEGEYSEKYYQDLIANKIQSNHHSLLLTKNDFIENVESIYNSYDSPSNDGVNTWFISQFARKNKLKAVLSGLGADELFGGYPSFTRLSQLKTLHQYHSIINIFSSILPEKLNRVEFLQLDPAISDYLLLRGFYAPSIIARLLGMDKKQVLQILNSKMPANARELKSLSDISIMEKDMYMQNQLLKDSDYMSMQHGIEIRIPFLDNELLHMLSRIEENDLFPSPGKKEVLIDSFLNLLPSEIYNRPKQGFQFPFKYWLKDSSFIEIKLSNLNFKNEYAQFIAGRTHWSKIWSLAQI